MRGGRARAGFTLIELMISVAIVGILASIAIPQYELFLLRSKRAELPLNVDGIRTVEQGYHAEWGFYTATELTPVVVPGRERDAWPLSLSATNSWTLLGWSPDGPVYGQYGVTANTEALDLAEFQASGYTDIDGDGNLAHYLATPAFKPYQTTQNTVY